jgi:preprotein translocase subunit SecG
MLTDRQNTSVALGDISWQSVIAGALCAAALSSVLLAFGATIGLSISSASPTWRDSSAALALLSGLFVLLQAIAAFGLGGYVGGRAKRSIALPATDVERSDGFHGLLVWALAVVIGAFLAASVTLIGVSSNKTTTVSGSHSTAEPLLSYELDRLFRAPRRSPNVDLSNERDSAGRILLTSGSHSGMTSDDRTYLVQEVGAVAGLAPPDAERRVDDVVTRSQTAIHNARRTAVILAFSAAAALLLGAVVAWSSAVAGGRHRDGEPLPRWMSHGDYLTRRRGVTVRAPAPTAPTPLPE